MEMMWWTYLKESVFELSNLSANSFVAGIILGTIAENFIIIMNKSDMTPTDNTFKLKVKRKKSVSSIVNISTVHG